MARGTILIGEDLGTHRWSYSGYQVNDVDIERLGAHKYIDDNMLTVLLIFILINEGTSCGMYHFGRLWWPRTVVTIPTAWPVSSRKQVDCGVRWISNNSGHNALHCGDATLNIRWVLEMLSRKTSSKSKFQWLHYYHIVVRAGT